MTAYAGQWTAFGLPADAHPCASLTATNAENPPSGGFSADKTDSLVWREVISKVKSSGVAVMYFSIPLLLK